MRRNSANAFGRRAIREVDVYATCMAVQNLWLAAQVEGLGVGWITIVDNLQLRELLRLPDEVVPIAYLCLGYSAETSHAIAPSSKIERCARPNTVYQEHWTDEGDQRSTEIRRLVASVID
jgi:5,6-dimethylbenzimidazole synthase